MKKKLSMLLVLSLLVTSMLMGSAKVQASTMGAIPISGYSDTFRVFQYDMDGYIDANSYYILPNPFDADDEFDFLLSGSKSNYVFANLNNASPQLTMVIGVFSTSGNFIKQYSTTVYNTSAVTYQIPAQGADRNIRVMVSSSVNMRVFQYGVITN